jgi:hypothetical protein
MSHSSNKGEAHSGTFTEAATNAAHKIAVAVGISDLTPEEHANAKVAEGKAKAKSDQQKASDAAKKLHSSSDNFAAADKLHDDNVVAGNLKHTTDAAAKSAVADKKK